ncbi:hypothetical protein D1BOALGB6SA_4756 [Olavius sp. associated proteobacterium Delta 1]|nr:hypothetical protein D1BOALGB6SA_4756 [Olavius sp. associated proteobacterium Delta 1]
MTAKVIRILIIKTWLSIETIFWFTGGARAVEIFLGFDLKLSSSLSNRQFG